MDGVVSVTGRSIRGRARSAGDRHVAFLKCLRWRVLMLRGFVAPTGVMVNSQGLPAPGPRLCSGPRGWKPLTIFRCPVGAENKQRNIKTGESG